MNKKLKSKIFTDKKFKKYNQIFKNKKIIFKLEKISDKLDEIWF